ncbi:MAG: hypothetical protein Q4G39_04895 [Brachymonas sp.]|nr:hypothetical protein [Brachymonas sp.]
MQYEKKIQAIQIMEQAKSIPVLHQGIGTMQRTVLQVNGAVIANFGNAASHNELILFRYREKQNQYHHKTPAILHL